MINSEYQKTPKRVMSNRKKVLQLSILTIWNAPPRVSLVLGREITGFTVFYNKLMDYFIVPSIKKDLEKEVTCFFTVELQITTKIASRIQC